MANDHQRIVFNVVDVDRDPDNTNYYGRAVQFDPVAFAKDPVGATSALQTVIAQDVAALVAGVAGRDGMEPVPDTLPQVFKFFDASTGRYVIAWRQLCRRQKPQRPH